MNYFKFGKGERNLVILPGLSVESVLESKDLIVEAYQVLEEEFTIYLLDYQRDVVETYTIEDMVKDVVDQIEILGLTHVSLFGISLGGMIAMKIASQYPEIVEQLVLGSTTAEVTPSRYQKIGEWVEDAKRKELEKLCLSFGKTVYPEAFYLQMEESFRAMAKTITEEERKRFIQFAESIKDFVCLNDLEKITCPTFVLGDKQDHVFDEEATIQIAKHLTSSKRVECYLYDGYGHAVYDMASDYKERVLRFLCA
ncbi:MAG: alpha/beta hydrolase [Solobacterium sp.]|nr:alpha/beta hydrolase [Solobacterium sp.]